MPTSSGWVPLRSHPVFRRSRALAEATANSYCDARGSGSSWSRRCGPTPPRVSDDMPRPRVYSSAPRAAHTPGTASLSSTRPRLDPSNYCRLGSADDVAAHAVEAADLGRKQLLVVHRHPNETSFTILSIRRVRSGGHEVTHLDFTGDGFCLSREERQEYEDPAQYRRPSKNTHYSWPRPKRSFRTRVRSSSHAKCLDRKIWAPGIAFDIGADGIFQTDRLDNIRKLGVVTTYGSPWWLIRLYMGDPERKLWLRAHCRSCRQQAPLACPLQYGQLASGAPGTCHATSETRSGRGV